MSSYARLPDTKTGESYMKRFLRRAHPPERQADGHRADKADGDGAESGYWDRSWQEAAELIDVLSLGDYEKRLVRQRWLEEGKHYDANWRGHRARGRWFRAVAVVLSSTVTVLAGLSAAPAVTAAVGGAAAITTAFDGIWRYGERWQPLRSTSMLLRAEGWRFLELTGVYEHYDNCHQKAVKPFLNKIEQIILEGGEEYLAVFQQRHDRH